jgi:hypothetical protein
MRWKVAKYWRSSASWRATLARLLPEAARGEGKGAALVAALEEDVHEVEDRGDRRGTDVFIPFDGAGQVGPGSAQLADQEHVVRPAAPVTESAAIRAGEVGQGLPGAHQDEVLGLDELLSIVAVGEREAVRERHPGGVLAPLRFTLRGLLIGDHLVVLFTLRVVPHLAAEQLGAVGGGHLSLEGRRGQPGAPALGRDEGVEGGASLEGSRHAG